MTKHTVQMTDELSELVSSVASEAGQTPEEFILSAIKQRLEDAEDLLAIAEYEQSRADGTLETHSLAEIGRQIGLDR